MFTTVKAWWLNICDNNKQVGKRFKGKSFHKTVQEYPKLVACHCRCWICSRIAATWHSWGLLRWLICLLIIVFFSGRSLWSQRSWGDCWKVETVQWGKSYHMMPSLWTSHQVSERHDVPAPSAWLLVLDFWLQRQLCTPCCQETLRHVNVICSLLSRINTDLKSESYLFLSLKYIISQHWIFYKSERLSAP